MELNCIVSGEKEKAETGDMTAKFFNQDYEQKETKKNVSERKILNSQQTNISFMQRWTKKLRNIIKTLGRKLKTQQFNFQWGYDGTNFKIENILDG